MPAIAPISLSVCANLAVARGLVHLWFWHDSDINKFYFAPTPFRSIQYFKALTGFNGAIFNKVLHRLMEIVNP